jgi:flagellar hook-associated protein 1 FlgK
MFNIARTGTAAARASLELTATNIANASNPDYARRTSLQSELVSVSATSRGVLNGVIVEGIGRAESTALLRQARDRASDLARADAELAGLRDAETALEQARLFETLVDFEAELTRLEGNPLEPALREAALESARQLAATFNLADQTLDNAREQVFDEATLSLAELNRQAVELARINADLSRAQPQTAEQAALLDARDGALRAMARQSGLDVSFDDRGVATVRLDATPAAVLVDGDAAGVLTVAQNPDGTIAFDLGGTAVALNTGTLAGQAGALQQMAGFQTELDDAAASVIARANAAQASGADAAGNPGQPFFAGANAATMSLALAGGAQIAAAPAGSPAGSSDASNLAALVDALGAGDGPVADLDGLLLNVSSRIAALDITRTGLAAVSQSADEAVRSVGGVDLDREAADLVRLQQAFEANARVIQVANELFDVILNLR